MLLLPHKSSGGFCNLIKFMNTSLVFITLLKIKGVGKKTLHSVPYDLLISIKNIVDIYEYAKELSNKSKRIEEITYEKIEKYYNEALKILEHNKKLGILTINKFEKEYPTKMLDLQVPPIILYAKGNIASLQHNGIAIIGTRNASAYGIKIGERLGEIVSSLNNTVISGLAEGCDTSAHIGCLSSNGITIAIMPTPLNTVYPKKNIDLMNKIIQNNGCVISEYAVGDLVTKANFVERDRLQCGLANGVIVVETSINGGTMYAVNGAKKLNKLIGCFNYSEQHYNKYPDSIGNKELISNGTAISLLNYEILKNFVLKCDIYTNDKRNKDTTELGLFY